MRGARAGIPQQYWQTLRSPLRIYNTWQAKFPYIFRGDMNELALKASLERGLACDACSAMLQSFVRAVP